ncbi:hypothetical protein [Streptomyces sp. ME19-01-6]|uniref:hypothetical protein n=1 Tax=Streptomyces sp. ME19-01-6 TaxID=3028686 RepID=UPI0029AB06E8|nr:hypothetical protein [Streptomyces sp. ME19-01-6]MDX3227020.1 hypothetical protein [Streptomyces sp. ME19-01-6]
MHMNSAPHLLIEDRPEFERVLDEALRTADRRADLSGIGQRLNNEQLRTMAMNAAAAIAVCAADEYHHFLAAREKLRQPAPTAWPDTVDDSEFAAGDTAGDGAAGDVTIPGGATTAGEVTTPDGVTTAGGFAATVGDAASGAGLVAVLSVLAPVLAGTAAVIFLLAGYLLHLLHPTPSIAQPMVTAGWLFAALTAAGLLIAAVGLLLTAMHNGTGAIRGSARSAQREEVDRAREAWRLALLERGVVPFLRDALADPAAADGSHTSPAPPPASSPTRPSSTYAPNRSEATGRTPHLGYSRPGFSTEGDTSKTRPRFTSPDFTSPDYGGSEHRPD